MLGNRSPPPSPFHSLVLSNMRDSMGERERLLHPNPITQGGRGGGIWLIPGLVAARGLIFSPLQRAFICHIVLSSLVPCPFTLPLSLPLSLARVVSATRVALIPPHLFSHHWPSRKAMISRSVWSSREQARLRATRRGRWGRRIWVAITTPCGPSSSPSYSPVSPPRYSMPPPPHYS